jgi:hypothetical protein
LLQFATFKLNNQVIFKPFFDNSLWVFIRSGKIMRRILRKIAEGELENIGDVTTLLDSGVVDEIKLSRK